MSQLTNQQGASSKVLQPLNEHDFYSTLADTSGTSIVFFTKPACGSCRAWYGLLDELVHKRPELNVYEVDASINTMLAREYDLFHLPALFLFLDGEYHAELQCEARLTPLLAELDRAMSGPAMEAP